MLRENHKRDADGAAIAVIVAMNVHYPCVGFGLGKRKVIMNEITAGGRALLSLFDMIYIINLPERRDRRAQMQQQLARVGLNLDHPKITLFPACKPSDAGEFPTIGTRGCFESYLAVFKDVLAAGHERILVIEDDANLARDFEAMMPDAANFLTPKGWDVMYGYSTDLDPVADPGPLRLVDPDIPVKCTHFVSFNRKAIEQALPYLQGIYERPMNDPRGGAMHVDGAFSWFRAAHPDIVTYAAKESLAIQRPSLSNIYPPKWYERTPPFSTLLSFARRMKAALR